MRGRTEAGHRGAVSVYIVRRETKTRGARWHVRYEQGRNDPIVHLGVFASEREAKLRRKAALEVVARGGIPQRARIGRPAPSVTVQDVADAWLATLHDLADNTLRYYRRTARTLPDWLARMDPAEVTHIEVQRWVDELKQRLARGSIVLELGVLSQALDYAGVPVNPIADRRVRLPRRERKVYRLPNRAQIARMHEALPSRVDLMLTLEHYGLRVHEAAALRVRDVDERRGRLLIADSKTASGVRFVERLPGAPPLTREGRAPGELVFRPSPQSFTSGLSKLYKDGTLPWLFSAHDFRHLHASRLLHEGILSPAQIAARLGHAHPGVTLSTYSHVVPPDD